MNAAIYDCLDRFQPGRSAFALRASFVTKLQSELTWTTEVIRAVEWRVRRIPRWLSDDDGGASEN
jgi:hypothetical protein